MPPKDDTLEIALAAQLARLQTGEAAPLAIDRVTRERLRAVGYLKE